ncbi:MAG: hypothetical protein AB7W47_11775 [Calditrichaceae bacterium]
MKNQIFTLLIILSFTFVISGKWQKNRVEIIFPVTQEIYDYTPSKNYITIDTRKNEYPYFTAYLYNKNGKKLFEKKLTQGNIKYHRPLENLGLHVLIISGHEAGYGLKKEPDQIFVYDLKNGSLIWETKSISSRYSLSPDEKKLLTCSLPDYGESKLEIISLEDRTKTIIDIPFVESDWYDNERIFLIQEEVRENPEYMKRRLDISKKERDIVHDLTQLKLQYDTNEISEDEYKKKYENLDDKKKKIFDERKKLKRNQILNRFEATTSKAIIYNIKNKKIEETQNIVLNASPYFKIYRNSDIGSIHIKNNEITLFGILQDNSSKKGISIVTKLSQNLMPQWVSNINDYRPILMKSDSVESFLFIKDQNIYSINMENGTLINVPQNKSFIERTYQSSVIKLLENIKSENNMITIFKEN